MKNLKPDKFLRDLFDRAVSAADPRNTIGPFLPSPPTGRTLVLSAGKAAASMAFSVETHWHGDIYGLAVTRYGHSFDCKRIEVIEAGHPLPDEVGRVATQRFLSLANELTEDDLLLFLISGGASALLVEPADRLDFEDKRVITNALLKSGAPINEINCLRKHLSAVKGGRLAAAAYPAQVITLAISDVPGDDPSVIGSGPTVGDPTTCLDALRVVDKFRINLPHHARAALIEGKWESLDPSDQTLTKTTFELIACPADSQNAAADFIRNAGLYPMLLGTDIEGEARELGLEHARLAVSAIPGVILSGGETTVTISDHHGRGGRNCEYLLSLAIALDGAPGIHAIACDTDGIDGTEDAAGAIIRPDTLARAKRAGLDANSILDNHDSYTFFDTLDDLVKTGPTLTNVNDFRAILISGGE
ncbi:MAG: putative hydroxypyruvate reductase [Alphaproteobacteria bacterium MarineAlpha11_Bin1]|nr:MAG: putative hydroxypyruvate reductase [Alphaproteobacteria bacterium MarineAlpha11_Bin1]|tara:strand:+ start:7220 stop:8473 length:1254 start_codon:yes stop_codon:yes gene_type:complete